MALSFYNQSNTRVNQGQGTCDVFVSFQVWGRHLLPENCEDMQAITVFYSFC